jgi:hypothetical protein
LIYRLELLKLETKRADTTVCGGSYKITQIGSLGLGITCPQIGHFAGIFRNPITFVVALQRLSYSKARVQENKAQRAAVQLN